MNNQPLVRQPAVAGRFYPDDPAELAALVRACLDQAPGAAEGAPKIEALGLMLPHAGYIFSGGVAGLTLGQIRPPEKVVLLGPSHTGRGATLSVWPGGAWRTPLGDAPVDEAVCSELIEAGMFSPDTRSHLADHALEVMLPFLQIYSPDLSVVPVTVSEYNLENLRRAGKILAEVTARRRKAGENICLLASSDMNHFLPHAENMRKDAPALERLRAFDPEGLFRVVGANGISMCGFAAVTLMLFACREMGAGECRITAHTSSGVTGRPYGADMQRVVGYAGAIIPAP